MARSVLYFVRGVRLAGDLRRENDNTIYNSVGMLHACSQRGSLRLSFWNGQSLHVFERTTELDSLAGPLQEDDTTFLALGSFYQQNI